LGAELGELMCGQDRIGGKTLRRSGTTQGCSANGRRIISRKVYWFQSFSYLNFLKTFITFFLL